MARRSSTQLIVIGGGVFIIGAALVFVALNAGDTPTVTPSPSPTATATTTATATPSPGVIRAEGGVVVRVDIPRGMQAVAVQMDAVPGLAGYVRPGDEVNVYATVEGDLSVRGVQAPFAKLILTNVLVLDRRVDEGGGQTYLVALDVDDSEKLIFYAKFQSLWAALVRDDAPNARTRGHNYRTRFGV
ncbi:MAG TPA: RcpC/CpaB family pilus assembly protein [Actinomycetota bacterium]